MLWIVLSGTLTGSFEPILRYLGNHLGLSWRLSFAIWPHLEVSWKHLKTKNFLETTGQKCQHDSDQISRLFGTHFGDQNLLIFGKIWDHFLDHFLITFWTTFGPILGPILGPDRPKKGQDEPKRAIKRFTEPKLCNSKNLKNHWFFKVFGVQRLPREPQEAQEGSQEAPKELQSFNKKGSKNRPKIYQILDHFWVPEWIPKWSQKWPKIR